MARLKKPEVISDGRTVWVNSHVTGTCIGRFGMGGIDIHHEYDVNSRNSTECLECTHHLPNSLDWDRFVAGMLEHHGTVVPKKHKPKWLKDS